jgi:hypothetical protein
MKNDGTFYTEILENPKVEHVKGNCPKCGRKVSTFRRKVEK